MDVFTRMLVPTDFSDCSREAVTYGVELAAKLGSALRLIHVFERPLYFEVGVAHSVQVRQEVGQWIEQLKTNAEAQLEAIAAEVRPRIPDVTTAVRSGLAVDEIIREVEEWSANLVVLGTHGRTGLPHVVLGSVAERVVRSAPCPVLTVRPVGKRS